jgi:hypothetical protein
LSAHSTSSPKIDGSEKPAFFPIRSDSATPRAREQTHPRLFVLLVALALVIAAAALLAESTVAILD